MRTVGPGRTRAGGFSLLEVMVALAILGLSLVVLVGITTDNVRATHHAKKLTTAIFLARAKMADVEDQVLEEGFVDNDQEADGDFADEGRPEFRWSTIIEKIELPTEIMQETQEAATEATQEQSDNPFMAMAGFMGGFMSTLIEPIRVGLEEAVRKVTVRVAWDEPGKAEQAFEVVTFMTDPAKLDMAVQAIGQPAGGGQQPGTGASPAAGGGTPAPAAAGGGTTPRGPGMVGR